ncbi:hypothetical protein [Deinococcus hohokamensis]|uniref:Uncharacterized protein n=1 Tax=Deinococcus hohokamensis TaxID=309883 RepID=A0ABV9I8W5_9DEIO
MPPRAEGLEQVRRWWWSILWLGWLGLSPVIFQSDFSPPDLFSDAVFPLVYLLGAGAAAGMVLGGVLHAWWPGASAGARAPLPVGQLRTLNLLSVILMVAMVLGVMAVRYARLRAEPSYAWSVLNALGRSLEQEGFSWMTCPGANPNSGPGPGGPVCLGTRQDGWMAAQGIQRALADREAAVIPLPLKRTGNLVGGQVSAGLLAYNFRRYPVQLRYQGLVYTGRQGPLSAAEQAQSTEFPSLVRLEVQP